MKTSKELYQERRKRIEDAIALKETDRTPTMAWVDSFAATYKQAPMSKFSDKHLYQSNVILETVKDFPDLDCPEGAFTPAKAVGVTVFKDNYKVCNREIQYLVPQKMVDVEVVEEGF